LQIPDSRFQIPDPKFQIPDYKIQIRNPQFEIRNPHSSPGLWSELRFRLRRPRGILTGTIDKLLITPAADGEGVDVEIIDFKTNRFSPPAARLPANVRSVTAKFTTVIAPGQASFDFDSVIGESSAEASPTVGATLDEQARRI